MYQINALNPKDEGHKARKRFGQNLHDQRVIAKLYAQSIRVRVIISSKLVQV